MVGYHIGVHLICVCGKKILADPSTASDFSKMSDIIANENLRSEHLHNIDETGLIYKLLPKKMFATAKGTSVPGFKTSK